MVNQVPNIGLYNNNGVNQYANTFANNFDDDFFATMYRINTTTPKTDTVQFNGLPPQTQQQPQKKGGSTLGAILKLGACVAGAVLLKKNWSKISEYVGKLFTKAGKVKPGKAKEALKAAEEINKPSTVTAETIDNILGIPKKPLTGAAATKHQAKLQKEYDDIFGRQLALKEAEAISKPSTVTAETIDNILGIPKKPLTGAAAAKHHAKLQKEYEALFA